MLVVVFVVLPVSVKAFIKFGGSNKDNAALASAGASKEASVDYLKKGLNSQNSGVLDPEVSALYARGIGGGDIEIVESSALVADIGPEGTEADLLPRKRTSDEISVYVVKEGDTLGQVAELFDVSVNTIVWANDVKGKTVSPGDELVILPITGVRHTVKKGDTLETIAKKYKSDLLEIAQFNGKDSDESLALGEIVIVPDGTVEAPRSSSSVSSGGGSSVAAGGSSSGYFVRPVNGGRRTQGIHGYNGIDIAAPVGTPIYAAASGKVIISKAGGWNGGYGNNIVIKHGNGMQTLYAHLSRNDVWSGAWVEQGQQIGAMGNTGRSTGAHLHFEVRGGHNPF